jgi:C-terminal processing protease CtpA/Prc
VLRVGGVPTEEAIARLAPYLRTNTGGDSSVVGPLLRGIEQRPELAREHRVFVLIGPGTFSSGMWAAIDLVLACDAVLIGEPTGGQPNAPGYSGRFALPNSTLDVNYARRMWTKGGERFDGEALEPDLLVRETSRDHFAGVDPALEAALVRAGK